MRERRPLFGYGLQRSGMSAVYHSVCERSIFPSVLIRCDIAVVHPPGSGKDIRNQKYRASTQIPLGSCSDSIYARFQGN